MNRAPKQEEDPFNPLYLDIEEKYPNPYENPYEEVEDDIANYYTKTFVDIYKKHTPEAKPSGKLRRLTPSLGCTLAVRLKKKFF